MKKFLALLLTSVFIVSTLAVTGCGDSSEPKETLKFYNWGEYIGEDVISNFEEEYNCTVINELFDSNEMMYTKIQAGDVYDVLVPSDYMIERLMNEDMLQPLDKNAIPNLANLADGVKNLDYDPDNTYSAPYFWGNVGIVYNKNNVDEASLQSEGWNILKDTKYKGSVYIYDSERDAFMVALKALGYSMNTEDENEINAAYEWLTELNSTMEPSYVTDDVIDAMANSSKDLAVVYSGDAAYILSQNDEMGFFMPNEGTNLWSDAMVIPKNAENPELANKFINYILDYDASYDNSATVGYTSSNAEVMQTLADTDYSGNTAYLPRTDNEKDEIFHDNEVLRKKLNDLWTRVKSAN